MKTFLKGLEALEVGPIFKYLSKVIFLGKTFFLKDSLKGFPS